jgi:hypothetical protein
MKQSGTCNKIRIAVTGSPLFQNSMCRLKILGAGRVTQHNFRSEGLQVLRPTVQNLDATVSGAQDSQGSETIGMALQ